jgi:membrane protein
MAAKARATDLLTRLPAAPVRLGTAWFERLVAIQFVDRATALAGMAFTALIPLLIVYDAVVPQVDGRDFADGLIDRFDLKGVAAASVRQALAPPGDVQSSVSVLGVILVAISALTFARGLQRMYEQAFQVRPRGGLRGTPSTLMWLALIPAFVTVNEVAQAIADPLVTALLTGAFGAVEWTVTPFVLLGRRLPWQRLLPTGLITAVAVTILGIASIIWMPHAVSESADRYGVIGIAFALLSWLVGIGFVLVGSAAAGAVVAERRWRAP